METQQTTAQELDETIANLVQEIAEAAADRKAMNIRAVDVRGMVTYSDYFVICSGRSDRQVRAIADHIIGEMREQGRRPIGVEGQQHGLWILIDFGDVVAHIFHENEREEYDIERLWSGAPKVKLQVDSEAPASLPN